MIPARALLVIGLVLATLPPLTVAQDFRIGIAFRAPISEFCQQVMSEAFQRLGLSATVLELPAERSIQMANDGAIDAECIRIGGIKALYPNLVQVPVPLLEVHFVGFVKNPDIVLESGWAGLKPYHVAAIYGWKILEVNIPKVEPRSFTRVPTAESMFRMLDTGRIEVATMNLVDGQRWIRKLGLEGIHPVLPPLATRPMYFYLHRKHAHLERPLARVIDEMKADGSWTRAEKQAFGALLYGIDI